MCEAGRPQEAGADTGNLTVVPDRAVVPDPYVTPRNKTGPASDAAKSLPAVSPRAAQVAPKEAPAASKISEAGLMLLLAHVATLQAILVSCTISKLI